MPIRWEATGMYKLSFSHLKISAASSSYQMSSSYQLDARYWIQQDKADYIKSLYAEHKTKFPKIKKDLGFSQLSSIDLKNVPWPLYVMVLTKQLNPLAYPEWTNENGNKTCCNICDIHFIPDAKNDRGE